MLVTDNILYDLICLFITFLAVVVTYCKWLLSYWKRKGLESTEESTSFRATVELLLGKKRLINFWLDTYFSLKSKGLKDGGVYLLLRPIYVPVDVQLIKNILTVDFKYFPSRGLYVDETNPLSQNIFNLHGDKWKMLRGKTTSSFSLAKIKMICNTVLERSNNLKDVLAEVSSKREPISIHDAFDQYMVDLIGSLVFGIDLNTLKNPQESELYAFVTRFVTDNFDNRLRFLFLHSMPHSVSKIFKLKSSSTESINCFTKLVEKIVKHREDNSIVRDDMMQVLLQLKNTEIADSSGKEVDSSKGLLNMKEFVGQCYTLLIAGFDTTSITLTMAIYELSANPMIQQRLRNEIKNILEKQDKLSYDNIMKMTYLDQVVCETLRKYPPAPTITRMCKETFAVPETDVVIDKDTFVVFPIQGIHYDPEYYPNPEKFDPERFTEEGKCSRPTEAWLPFGSGPKNCIGKTFAMTIIKLTIASLLRNFSFSLNKKMTPFKMKQRNLIISPEETIWIDVHKIDQ